MLDVLLQATILLLILVMCVTLTWGVMHVLVVVITALDKLMHGRGAVGIIKKGSRR